MHESAGETRQPIAGPRFWATSCGMAGCVAVVWGLVVRVIPSVRPREGLLLVAGVDLWLLGVFTGGVLAVLLGISAGVGGRLPGRSAREAVTGPEIRSEARGDSHEPDVRDRGAAWWIAAVGVELLAIYLVGWFAVG